MPASTAYAAKSVTDGSSTFCAGYRVSTCSHQLCPPLSSSAVASRMKTAPTAPLTIMPFIRSFSVGVNSSRSSSAERVERRERRRRIERAEAQRKPERACQVGAGVSHDRSLVRKARSVVVGDATRQKFEPAPRRA
eukprot:5382395-Prymnesium_polylepis.1